MPKDFRLAIDAKKKLLAANVEPALAGVLGK